MYQPIETARSSAPTEAGRPGIPVDPRRLIWAVRDGVRVIAISAILSAIVGTLVAVLVLDRTYAAETTLVWASTDDTLDPVMQARVIGTVVASVELPTNLAEIRRRLEVTSTLTELAARLEVVHEDESQLITLRALGPTGEEARELVATATDVLVAHRENVERARIQDELTRVERALASAERQRDEERRTYDAFREEHGITDLPAELELAIASAADLRARALVAHADADAETARASALHEAERSASATTVLAETTSDPGAERLGETRASLATARARLSGEHPQIRALEEEASALAARHGTELVTSRTVGRNPEWGALREGAATATAEREAAHHREAALAELSESERGRVDRLAAVEGRVAELLAGVVVADARVTQLRGEQNAANARLDALSADLRVIAPALAPEWPVRSPRRIVAMSSPLVGIVLATLALLLRATWRLRVHTASEASFWSNLPTIASSVWPREPRRLHELAGELAALVGPVESSVLVVSLEDPSLARDVARALGRRLAVENRSSRSETSRNAKACALRAGTSGQALRRAARAAERVLVLVPSGAASALALLELTTSLGRSEGVGLVVVGLGPNLATLSDRSGPIETFARTSAPSAASTPSEPSEAST